MVSCLEILTGTPQRMPWERDIGYYLNLTKTFYLSNLGAHCNIMLYWTVLYRAFLYQVSIQVMNGYDPDYLEI